MTQIGRAFELASKNLKGDEKNFKRVNLFAFRGHNDPITLEDNTFGDITFETFYGTGIKKIGSNAFNKTTDKLQTFFCDECDIINEPPKYDIQKVKIMQFEKQNLNSF